MKEPEILGDEERRLMDLVPALAVAAKTFNGFIGQILRADHGTTAQRFDF